MGVVFGALVGATPFTSLVTAWAIPSEFGVATAIGGAAVGALLGFVLGEGRARQLRGEVQRTLCAMCTERAVDAILQRLDASEAEPDDRSTIPDASAILPASPTGPPDMSFSIGVPIADKLAEFVFGESHEFEASKT